MSKRYRLEIRISEHEKEIIEQIKQSTGKNISELMREFLNSFDVENSKKELEKLREERGLILHQLNSIYSELRSHYLPVKEICQITNISRASLYRKLTTIQ